MLGWSEVDEAWAGTKASPVESLPLVAREGMLSLAGRTDLQGRLHARMGPASRRCLLATLALLRALKGLVTLLVAVETLRARLHWSWILRFIRLAPLAS